MPVQVSYPGVYIQEIPSSVHSIVGVSTSATAFVDVFRRGPVNTPVRISSMADLERTFGGLWSPSEASYAISQYFLNGGQIAWVVRVVPAGAAAATPVSDVVVHDTTLHLTAADEGSWGNNLEVSVATPKAAAAGEGANTFDLAIREVIGQPGKKPPTVLRSEIYKGLTLADGPRCYIDVINAESALLRARRPDPATSSSPAEATDQPAAPAAADPTAAADPPAAEQPAAEQPAAEQPAAEQPAAEQPAAEQPAAEQPAADTPKADKPTDDARPVPAASHRLSALFVNLTPAPARGASASPRPVTGDPDALVFIDFHGGADATGDDLSGLPGQLCKIVTGSDSEQTGIYALRKTAPEMFNLLCLPATTQMSKPDAASCITAAAAFSHSQRAVLLVDCPLETTPADMGGMSTDLYSTLDSNAVVYYPALSISDPLNANRQRKVGPSGTMAGVIARTDNDRGIWKAPAGTDAVLRGAMPSVQVNDEVNGTLSSEYGINVIRTFPVYGTVSWGARTVQGGDDRASQWKYLPVRRLALHIENSLFVGTKWAVFEPNDEPLWGQLRLNVGTFMHDLFRQGAFAGASPSEAYLVNCDSSTTTESDRNNGIVNIVVGFAPAKPAEFVIVSIQQLAQG